MGIGIGPGCENIKIKNSRRQNKLPDAHVLCTSLDTKLKKFGDYGVAIHNLAEFGQLVTWFYKVL